MSRFEAPEGSVTERAVRMAWRHEYMVPIETCWELEQALDNAREEIAKLKEAARNEHRLPV